MHESVYSSDTAVKIVVNVELYHLVMETNLYSRFSISIAMLRNTRIHNGCGKILIPNPTSKYWILCSLLADAINSVCE
jgi:hypothetical protein